MPPRKKLSNLDRARAIGWLQDSVAARQVAPRLAVAPFVIIRLKQRFHAAGRVQERQRSRRPRVTSQREDRFIQRQAMQQRMATANNIRQRLQATTATLLLVVRRSETAYTTLACVQGVQSEEQP
ncbi:hypothetical protein V1264_006495 [Littorina saxatilis]|uniref:Uncharacterized protein n=1 Tax=Littorina saxatilis TaxID=31220 RepID=A0AAN9AZG8_9CAEN